MTIYMKDHEVMNFPVNVSSNPLNIKISFRFRWIPGLSFMVSIKWPPSPPSSSPHGCLCSEWPVKKSAKCQFFHPTQGLRTLKRLPGFQSKREGQNTTCEIGSDSWIFFLWSVFCDRTSYPSGYKKVLSWLSFISKRVHRKGRAAASYSFQFMRRLCCQRTHLTSCWAFQMQLRSSVSNKRTCSEALAKRRQTGMLQTFDYPLHLNRHPSAAKTGHLKTDRLFELANMWQTNLSRKRRSEKTEASFEKAGRYFIGSNSEWMISSFRL